MERSDALIKLVSVIVFVAMMIYLGVSFISSYRDPLRTVTVRGMELHDGVDTQGYIVRDEQVITAPDGNVAVTASDGDKLAAGETVAYRYVGSAAMERAQRIGELRLRIRQLTALKNGRNSEALAREALLDMSRVASSGNYKNLYGVEQDVRAYIFTAAASTGGEEQEIAALQAELDGLLAASSTDTENITAPWSGTFSPMVDGFETVGPEDLEDLTPDGVDSLFSGDPTPESGAIGRLSRGMRWYYVTKVDEAAAKKLRVGSVERLIFSKNYSSTLDMTVDSMSIAEDGKCAVVFRCDKYLQDVVGLRDVSAQIVFGTLTGVSVPREAVHLNEKGESVVYILEGVTAHETAINIIAESGDYYMVEATRTGLREGDLAIVRANNLYDGAVVER